MGPKGLSGCGAITIKLQELAEPEPQEAEAEIVSSAATRAAKLLAVFQHL